MKEDFGVTQRLHEAKFFEDHRSWVSLDGHLKLFGADKSKRRILVFKKHKNRCVVCGHKLDPDAPDFHPNRGAWHHPGPCDCISCSELRCDTTTGRKCHAHRTPGFERVANAESN